MGQEKEKPVVVEGEERLRLTRVLIVDDSDSVLEPTCLYLEWALKDYPILSAQNGEQALKVLREIVTPLSEQGVLVLTDLEMPVMGGKELIEIVRGDEDLRSRVKFMVWSGSLEKLREIEKAYPEIPRYLKPMTGRQILSELKEILGQER